MKDKKRIIIISIITLAIIIVSLGITYAWYTWNTDEENKTKITTSLGAAMVYYDAGSNIEGANLKPTATKEEGIVKKITVSSNINTTYKLSFNLYLDIITIDDGLKDASFKYALYQDGIDDPIKSGSFTEEYLDTLESCTTNNTNHIELVFDETITETLMEYTLYIWIDGTMSNPNTMQGNNFKFKLHADGQNAILGETLISHISNLYTPDSTVKDGFLISYDIDTKNQLINDKVDTLEKQGITTGNIRYYGKSPKNYIDIGDVYTKDTSIDNFEKNEVLMSLFEISNRDDCYTFFDCETNYSNIGMSNQYTDKASCEVGLKSEYGVDSVEGICGVEIKEAGEPKLYRIIGLFKDIETSTGEKKDLVKVIREDSIGNFAWDLTGASEDDFSYDNNWHDSTLMTILNNSYYNASESVAHLYLDIDGNLKNPIVDFTGIGLHSSVQNKIETVNWNLGSGDVSKQPAIISYMVERQDGKCTDCTYETIWPGKIALMYPSDYGFATDFNVCGDKTLGEYADNVECVENNWLYSNVNMSNNLLMPGGTTDTVLIQVFGGIFYDETTPVAFGFGVRPTFFLKSGLGIVTGDGSETAPYVVR